jgi:hypothetical protein
MACLAIELRGRAVHACHGDSSDETLDPDNILPNLCSLNCQEMGHRTRASRHRMVYCYRCRVQFSMYHNCERVGTKVSKVTASICTIISL